ncbi:MAG: sel1 repeat family protein [Halopseudomonas aestusnigri]|nr:sel1 repeat family protein [Halopseudomonas aestusnigri]
MLDAHTADLLCTLLPLEADIVPLIEGSPRSLYVSAGTPSIRRHPHDQHCSVPDLTIDLQIRRCLDIAEISELYARLGGQALKLDVAALNDLGWMWMTGTHLQTNQTQAVSLLTLAEAHGSGEAAFNLAERAYYGKGCAVDLPQAVERYTNIAVSCTIVALKAAAAQALARMYADGEVDGEADPESAILWYQHAINLGDKTAVIEQSKLKLDVYSPCEDTAAAVIQLQNAALEGLVEASHFLADLYAGQIPYTDYPSDPDKRMQRFWRELALEQEAAKARKSLTLPSDGRSKTH